MVVTLYKECKLNNKYNDCFFNTTYLDTYLNTLTKLSITVDTVFSREEDRIILEDTTNFIPKEYNYIKIVDTTFGTFYAFIKNIQWVNGLVIIYYEEDIWHNWFSKIKVRNGLLTRSLTKKIHYSGETEKSIKYFSYPIESESNDTPLTTNLRSSTAVCIVVKLQLYTLSVQGTETERFPVVYYLGIKSVPQSEEEPQTIDINFSSDYEDVVIDFINGQQTKKINGYSYQIDEIYFVPIDFIGSTSILPAETLNFDVQPIYPNLCVVIPTFSSSPIRTYTKTISYDRKNFAIGNYSNPIRFTNNGTNITIKAETYCTGSSFKILLYLNNNIIDLTKDYYVELPFNTITSSALQIKRMQYDNDKASYENEVKNLNERIKGYKGALVGSSLSLAGGITSGIGSIVGGNIIGGIGKELSNIGKFTSDISSEIANIDIAKNNIEYYQYKTDLLNRKIYDNTYIVKNDINFINGLKGLLLWKCNEDNTSQIDGVKNLFGFIVNELITKNLFTAEENTSVSATTEKYNIYKFDDISVYGVIAQDYVNFFEKVLNKGVRIWYKGDISI